MFRQVEKDQHLVFTFVYKIQYINLGFAFFATYSGYPQPKGCTIPSFHNIIIDLPLFIYLFIYSFYCNLLLPELCY